MHQSLALINYLFDIYEHNHHMQQTGLIITSSNLKTRSPAILQPISKEFFTRAAALNWIWKNNSREISSLIEIVSLI